VAKYSPNDLSKAAIDSARLNFLVSRHEKLGSSGSLSGDSMKTVGVTRGQRLAVAAVSLLSTASIAFAGAQKKSTKSIQANPDPLVNAALKNMETGVWSVNGTVSFKKIIKLHGLLSGEDFDLSMEPGVKRGVPLRGIVIKDKAWVCSDGETWHAGQPDDRLLYNWVHVPIMADRKLPPFEKVGSEQRNEQTRLHVRLKVPEKKINPKELPQFGLRRKKLPR
jgi:hypothetical protein